MKHAGVKRLRVDPARGIAIYQSRELYNCHRDVQDLINCIGVASSKEQGLGHVITTYSSLMNEDYKLYILVDDDKERALGFIKTGYRHLFLWDRLGGQHELTPLCLLDFFIHPSAQRQGFGKKMYDIMLDDQGIKPMDIAIDRPSPSCIRFMKKHYNLAEYVVQSNHYVVFDEYWHGRNGTAKLKARTPRMTGVTPKITTPIVSKPKLFKTPSNRSRYNPITWQPM